MRTTLISLLFLFSFQINANSQIITTVAGNGYPGFNSDDIPATDASMSGPTSVVVDKDNNFYFSSRVDCRIRKVNSSGIISTVAGNGTAGFSGDGGMATEAQINYPYGIALDNDNNIYICDAYNHRIRKVGADGRITTVAGTGEYGYGGDGGPATAAKIWNPYAVFIDKAGNTYIADAGNDRIRRINTTGDIVTIAGTGTSGYNGDNIPATDAMLNMPSEVAVDSKGNIYIGDVGNRRLRVIESSGLIKTIAGNGTIGYSGDGGPATSAQISMPYKIEFDNSGKLYIADPGTRCIRKIDNSGTISTIAGTGALGFSGDGGPATAAKFNAPHSIALDNIGSLYVADFGNKRIRLISNVVAVHEIQRDATKSILLYPNPGNGNFCFSVPSAIDEEVSVVITNITGGRIKEIKTSTNELVELDLEVPSGIYVLSAFTEKQRWNSETINIQ